MSQIKAVLLLSSGLDSAANLVLEGNFEVKLALTIDYGQKGAMRELAQAGRLARYFNIEHMSFDLRDFGRLTGAASALMGSAEIPSPESLDDLSVTRRSAKAVWVPNRNGVMISLAAALAEARGCDAVAVGFNVEEAATFPDNSAEYISAMTESLSYSTANKVRVVSATAAMTKIEIVRKLAGLNFPFDLLWSCYEAGKKHCGRCESCKRLRRAMREGLISGTTLTQALESVFGETNL